MASLEPESRQTQQSHRLVSIMHFPKCWGEPIYFEKGYSVILPPEERLPSPLNPIWFADRYASKPPSKQDVGDQKIFSWLNVLEGLKTNGRLGRLPRKNMFCLQQYCQQYYTPRQCSRRSLCIVLGSILLLFCGFVLETICWALLLLACTFLVLHFEIVWL